MSNRCITFIHNFYLYLYLGLYLRLLFILVCNKNNVWNICGVIYTLEDLKRNKMSVKINQQVSNGESHAFGRLSLLRGITPIFAGLKHVGLSSPLY